MLAEKLVALANHRARNLAADVANLALQVADAGLARVVADDSAQRVVFKLNVGRRQSGLLELLLHQVLARDLKLFRLGVAVQPQHFHAVLQRRGNGVQHIGRGDEENLRQVVLHVQVVIDEHEVLFRDRALPAAPKTGSPRKSLDILSTSSSMNTGLRVPAFFIIWMIWPGSAPM